MRTSIRSRLFLIIYGIILTFIVGLILLNTVFLEGFYTKSRERTLVSAFAELETVSLSDAGLSQTVIDIENQYAVDIQILKQTDADPGIPAAPAVRFPPCTTAFTETPSRFATASSPRSCANSTTATKAASPPIDVSDDDSYVAYMTEIVMAFAGDAPENPRLLALCVGQMQNDGLYVYYILTVTIQSIQNAIGIFNAFTIIIAAIFMILSGIAVAIFSRHFTQPILQMNAVTQNLASQDFTKRVAASTKDELGDLGQSINKMSDQLETSIRDLKRANQQLAEDIELKNRIDTMRKEFIANASHELKTPISLILGYSEALKLTGLDEMTVAEYLDIIIDESEQDEQARDVALEDQPARKRLPAIPRRTHPRQGARRRDDEDFLDQVRRKERRRRSRRGRHRRRDRLRRHSDRAWQLPVQRHQPRRGKEPHRSDRQAGRRRRIRVEVFNTGKPIPRRIAFPHLGELLQGRQGPHPRLRRPRTRTLDRPDPARKPPCRLRRGKQGRRRLLLVRSSPRPFMIPCIAAP
ncbi:MAG: HAMP domain-containing protein [Candidatus Moduliflexus flocculans]|nr:HAMP domain-containing protein [Candidatus Moduliflexus flocculans]